MAERLAKPEKKKRWGEVAMGLVAARWEAHPVRRVLRRDWANFRGLVLGGIEAKFCK